MSSLRSKLVFFGLIIFTFTFFLPPEFYNSPFRRFRWALEAVFLSDSRGEMLAFIGICLAIVYPYFWALITALFFIAVPRPNRWSVRIQFLIHILGGIPIVSLGVTLIIVKAEFPPPEIQWGAALFPVILVLVLFLIASIIKFPRKFPALVSVALLVITPIQLILYHLILLDGGVGWGYLLGGLGALAGFLGSLSLVFKPR